VNPIDATLALPATEARRLPWPATNGDPLADLRAVVAALAADRRYRANAPRRLEMNPATIDGLRWLCRCQAEPDTRPPFRTGQVALLLGVPVWENPNLARGTWRLVDDHDRPLSTGNIPAEPAR